MLLQMSVSKILSLTSKLPKEMTSYMIYIVALGLGIKCPCKIHLITQCQGGHCPPPMFVRSVNPIQTGGWQIIPNYTTAPKLKAIQWGTTFSDMGSDNWLVLAFFKLELWNFQDILDLWFREASQNLNLFRHFFS